MNILALNGSPKGKYSITIQTILFFEAKYPEHNFQILNIGQRIKQYEKDFSEIKTAITDADLIIFSYPVYTFLIPFQLLRFIELLKENDVNFARTYVAQLSTSKHFYDVTAHKFLEENIYDLCGRYLGGLSADMDDLTTTLGQKQATDFFDKILFDTSNNIFRQRFPSYYLEFDEELYLKNVYTSKLKNKKELEHMLKPKSKGRNIIIVTNSAEKDDSLNNMITDFTALSLFEIKIINVREFKFDGGCLGCLNCTNTGKCIYRDGFEDYLRNEISNAEGIIYAFNIENHYTHSSMKCFDDRQFCNGHRTSSHGIPVGYIISGEYDREYNLQTIVEARSEVAGSYLCGVVTDEYNVDYTALCLQQLYDTFIFALDKDLQKPTNFYGVGGMKIFRDMVYLMRGMMTADHKHYKENGMYDFPHNQKLKAFQMKILGTVLASPKMRAKIGNLNPYIIKPYEQIIEKAKADNNSK